jgi:hypothetical protein
MREKRKKAGRTGGKLNEQSIVEAVQSLLQRRGLIPTDGRVGYFRWKFGLVGEPQVMLVGDACDDPNAGQVYIDWSFEPLDNVRLFPKSAPGKKKGA